MSTFAFSILNRNGLEDTMICIDTLLHSTYQDITIYVLDNGSDSPEEFETLQQTYWSHPNIILNKSSTNLWFTGGNNFNLRLIQKSNTRFICLLNNDCLVAPDFLQKLLATLDSLPWHEIWVFGPIIHNIDGSIQSAGSDINLWFWTNPRRKYIHGQYQHVDCVSGSCFFITKELLETVGLLDDTYFAYREESDYCLRAKALTYPIICLNISGITHKEETASSKKKPYYTYLMFRNRILFLRKHANFVQYSMSWIVWLAYLGIVFPRRFGRANLPHAWKGIRDGILSEKSS